MGFNYGLEKKKFDKEWEKLRKEYRAAGMDEAAIEAMHEFDWDVFKSERIYCNHTQRMPSQNFDDDGDVAGEDNSALLHRFFDSFAVMPKEVDDSRRDSWVDEIESEEVSVLLRTLSAHQIEILTLVAFEGYSSTEAARKLGLTQQGVSWHISKFRKIFKNIKSNL